MRTLGMCIERKPAEGDAFEGEEEEEDDGGEVLGVRKTRWRIEARKRAMGKFRPRLRSPRRESRKVIVVGFEGRAKKVRRRWKGVDILDCLGRRGLEWKSRVPWCYISTILYIDEVMVSSSKVLDGPWNTIYHDSDTRNNVNQACRVFVHHRGSFDHAIC